LGLSSGEAQGGANDDWTLDLVASKPRVMDRSGGGGCGSGVCWPWEFRCRADLVWVGSATVETRKGRSGSSSIPAICLEEPKFRSPLPQPRDREHNDCSLLGKCSYA